MRRGHILHCCTTKNPNYNIHCPSSHSLTHPSIQLLPITPVTSMSSFTSRVFFCAVTQVRVQITMVRTAMVKTAYTMPGSGFVAEQFFFPSISYNSCCDASAKMDGKRSHSMSQFAVSSLQKCPALYLGVGLPVH